MEGHDIKESKIELLRNIDNFGCLVRAWEHREKISFIWRAGAKLRRRCEAIAPLGEPPLLVARDDLGPRVVAPQRVAPSTACDKEVRFNALVRRANWTLTLGAHNGN